MRVVEANLVREPQQAHLEGEARRRRQLGHEARPKEPREHACLDGDERSGDDVQREEEEELRQAVAPPPLRPGLGAQLLQPPRRLEQVGDEEGTAHAEVDGDERAGRERREPVGRVLPHGLGPRAGKLLLERGRDPQRERAGAGECRRDEQLDEMRREVRVLRRLPRMHDANGDAEPRDNGERKHAEVRSRDARGDGRGD